MTNVEVGVGGMGEFARTEPVSPDLLEKLAFLRYPENNVITQV
jgi:hypothetical protein